VIRRLPGLALAILVLAGCLPQSKSHQGLMPPKAAARQTATATHLSLTIVPPASPQPSRTPYPPSGFLEPGILATAWSTTTPVPPPAEAIPLPAHGIGILLLGSDRRSGESFRTDTLVYLLIDPDQPSALMLSIPRDLYVYIPGFSMGRINTAWDLGSTGGYPGGGFGLLADTLRYNLGLRADYFALVEMDGFRQLISDLGGIDVSVACPYTDWHLKQPELPPDDPANWALYTQPAGVSHMDAEQALWYARSRLKSSDFDRGRRQQEMLRAMLDGILRIGAIQRLPELYGDLTQTVLTDLSLEQLARLGPLAVRLRTATIRSRFIGRDEVTSWQVPESGAQVLLPKPEPIRRLLLQAMQPESAAADAPPNQVVIINRSGHADWGELAAERLGYAGISAVQLPDDGPPQDRTQWLDHQTASPSLRQRLLQVMGPQDTLITAPAASPAGYGFTVILGSDYQPCFDPTRDGFQLLPPGP
jgi:LCP family protein required for cell wall assembly